MNTIWLVGASEGIGRALAVELSKNTDNCLILSARNRERLSALSAELKTKPHLIPVDVEDPQAIQDAWKDVQQKGISVDTLIYCAGYYVPMSAEQMVLEPIEKMINVNLVGALRFLNFMVPYFIKQKKGHIVLIGSVAGYRGLPHAMGYGASKAGLLHLGENLKCDLAKHNIKVQVINPGFVKTRLTSLNTFYMPSLMTAEKAAHCIIKAMQKNSFESRFPFLFANITKLSSQLPYCLYFKLIKLLEPKNKT